MTSKHGRQFGRATMTQLGRQYDVQHLNVGLGFFFFTNINTVVIEMIHMNTDYLRTIMIYYVLSIDVFSTNEFFS